MTVLIFFIFLLTEVLIYTFKLTMSRLINYVDRITTLIRDTRSKMLMLSYTPT
jgi:hypothetical protein